MDWLGRIYARRIVNVNVNIIIAGLLAMLLTIVPVHATRYFGIESAWVITGVALGFDAAFDVAIFYLLHWLANHMHAMPWARHRNSGLGMSYFRDATLVQFERAMLIPVYYGVAVTMMQLALYHNLHRELAAVIGLCSGLGTTRIVHTLWMLRMERRRVLGAIASPPRCISCGQPLARQAAGCPECARLTTPAMPRARETAGSH
jgi:hypothetical protein